MRQLYMLHDKVWNLTGVPYVFGNLHIGCVEKRIGRRLAARDFYYGVALLPAAVCGGNRRDGIYSWDSVLI
jgi:hypothetical protein